MIARASCRLPEVESYANDPVTLPMFSQVACPPERDREVMETVCGRVRANAVDRVNGFKWELYDLTKDWNQNIDLAAANPGKLKEMQQLFLSEAAKYQLFPSDNPQWR